MRVLLFAGALLLSSASHAIDIEKREVRAFIDEMVREFEYDRAGLERTLKAAERKQSILDAISRPAEKTLSWAEYRKIFITPERIAAGVDFWRENCAMLTEIADSSGVPEEILVGIIGAYFHIRADLTAQNIIVPERFLRGAPFLSPLFFSNMGVVGLIALLPSLESE